MENNPLISVIVPVYNVEAYLEKCVRSILSQTYPCFELLLVDDGSKDNSGMLCDALVQEDTRIKCIHKQNGGLSSARNAALDICGGEYITFVDSDDMISPNALETMLNCALQQQSDIVITEGLISYSDKVEVSVSTVSGVKTYGTIDALQQVLCRNTRWEACGNLYHKDLWKEKRFPLGRLYEDLATIPYIMMLARSVSIMDTSIYYYFTRPGSIMHHKDAKVSMDLCINIKELIAYFSKEISNKQSLANICSGILMELCSRVDYAANHIVSNREFVKEGRVLLRRHIKHLMSSNMYDLKKKVYYILEACGYHKLIYLIHGK